MTEIVQFFDDLFDGGSDSPPIPRQLRHGRHPLYPVILGVQDGLIPTEASAGAPQFCGDPMLCTSRPLADDKILEIPQAMTPATPTPVPPMSCADIKLTVDAGHFSGQNALEIEKTLESQGVPQYIAKPASLDLYYGCMSREEIQNFNATPTPVPP